jgi:hypothetical protein
MQQIWRTESRMDFIIIIIIIIIIIDRKEGGLEVWSRFKWLRMGLHFGLS